MVTALITSQFSTITYAFYGCMHTNCTCQVSEFLHQDFTLHSGSTCFHLKILAGCQYTSLRFYSLAPGPKLTWYKSSHYRVKSPFGVQIFKLLTTWFQISYIFRPLNSVTFLPPCPILLLPYLVFPVLLVGYRHWPSLWWHLNQHIVQKHSIISQLSKHLQQTSSS